MAVWKARLQKVLSHKLGRRLTLHANLWESSLFQLSRTLFKAPKKWNLDTILTVSRKLQHFTSISKCSHGQAANLLLTQIPTTNTWRVHALRQHMSLRENQGFNHQVGFLALPFNHLPCLNSKQMPLGVIHQLYLLGWPFITFCDDWSRCSSPNADIWRSRKGECLKKFENPEGRFVSVSRLT